ncbi:hypothetical protein C1N32_20730 [Vibrio diazotrophicus]|uniref:Uncharacterized protein n=1 Tax=Vibrio diazotrophicus TaxID=685 RepID=A0A2J8HSM4_VIBDI|nr:hypothetical protein [Vibrio diazotrophicus]PNI01191.1 hypothetical protein C1N32_20730 [Vibrio diazotrophicus]
MSNKNIVLMLQDGLSSSTRQDIYPADLASLLGYGATQLKQYVKWAKAGHIEKPNERLERAAALAYRCGELEGFESLFPLIPKLSGDLNDEEWFRRTGMRMDKMIRADASTAGQLDLIESVTEPENDHQIKKFFGFASPMNLDMLRMDTESGHISESYETLLAELHKMFGELGHYDFDQVKAALVAIECPEIVTPVESVSIYDQNVKAIEIMCETFLAESIPDEEVRATMAVKIAQACQDSGISQIKTNIMMRHDLSIFVQLLNDLEHPSSLTNIRLARKAVRESSVLAKYVDDAKEPENDHQNNDILWPDFVDASTRNWLEGFDREQLDFALSQKGELVVQRILAGYVKEQKQRALDNEVAALAR